MAHTAVPCSRSRFEIASQSLEPTVASNDDDDEYIPESLRLFVAQAEMKQESVISLISNEMSGEEIEKTISEDFEATMIDLPPPSSSATSGEHPVLCSTQGNEGIELRSEGFLKRGGRPGMAKKNAASRNASHLRKLIGSSASKPKEMQQRPSRRRTRVESTFITCPEHAEALKLERSPLSSNGNQTTSTFAEGVKAMLSPTLLPESSISPSAPFDVTVSIGAPFSEPGLIVPREELPMATSVEKKQSLSMDSFDDEEVPESLRSLFLQADQALRQTQQEFLDVARGCPDSTGLPKHAGDLKSSDLEALKQSTSLDENRSVEFPLSLYAIGAETGASYKDATAAVQEVGHEPILAPSVQHDGVDLEASALEQSRNAVLAELLQGSKRKRGLSESHVLFPVGRINNSSDSSFSLRAEQDSSDMAHETTISTSEVSCSIAIEREGQVAVLCKPLSPPQPLLRISSEHVVETSDSLDDSSTRRDEAGFVALNRNREPPETDSLNHSGESLENRQSHMHSASRLEGSSTSDEGGRSQPLHACVAHVIPLNFITELGPEEVANAAPCIVDPQENIPEGVGEVVARSCDLEANVESTCQSFPSRDKSSRALVCAATAAAATTEYQGVSDGEALDAGWEISVQGTLDSTEDFAEPVADECLFFVHSSDKQHVQCDDLETGFSSSPSPLSISGPPTTEKPLQASVSQTIFNVDVALTEPPGLLRTVNVASKAVSARHSPCLSDDNQSGNFMPNCCSPAQASSNGTKAHHPEAQETESEESSIRNPPSIVQVPSPFRFQAPAFPFSIKQVRPCNEEASTHSAGASRDAIRVCNDDVLSDRVASTLTASDSEEAPSVITVDSTCKFSARAGPLVTISAAAVPKKELNQIEEGTIPYSDPISLKTENGYSPDEGPSASCDRVPLFGAFDMPKSVLSFVAFADEMLAQGQSQFLCCGQDQLVNNVSNDPKHLNSAESKGAATVVERQDSMWNVLAGSGSSDPLPAIPVEAVLRCARRENAIEDCKEEFRVCEMPGLPEHVSRGIDGIEAVLTVNRSGGRDGETQLELVHHVDGRTMHSECIADQDVDLVTGADSVIHNMHIDERTLLLDCSGNQHVDSVTDAELTTHESTNSTCVQATEPSGLPPSLSHASLGLDNVQSIESSHGWNETVDEEFCPSSHKDVFDGESLSRCGSHEDHNEEVKSPESTIGTSKELSIFTGVVGMLHFEGEPEDATANEVDLETAQEGEGCATSEDENSDNSMGAAEGHVRLEHSVIIDQDVTVEERDSAPAPVVSWDALVPSNDSKEQPVLSTAQDLALESEELPPSSVDIASRKEALDHRPGLGLLPLDRDEIQSTKEPETMSNGINRPLDSESVAEAPATGMCASTTFTQHESETMSNGIKRTLDPESIAEEPASGTSISLISSQSCIQKTESHAAETMISRSSLQPSSSDRNDLKSSPKRLVSHSPRNWRSSNQKRAEEARARAIERIRERKLKEKQSLMNESRENEVLGLKPKRLQYSAQEGVARAIRRMKEFRKSEQAHLSGPRNSTMINARQSESATEQGCSGAGHVCLKPRRVHKCATNEAIKPRGRYQCTKPSSTTSEDECQCRAEALTTREYDRHKLGVREPSRQSFIVAPRATRGYVAHRRRREGDCRDRISSRKQPQVLPPARSMDEPRFIGEESASVALQSAKSFPSYMRPTISSSASANRSTEMNPWVHPRSDVSLAASSRVLQSMLRSGHPVVMNTGLWKWYARPLPPRTQTTQRKQSESTSNRGRAV